MKLDCIIVGAGLTGLAIAHHLQKAGKQVRIIEATDSVGGRVKSDHIDGFILDAGFQVLLNEYPEAKELLNYEKLELKSFLPGAYMYTGDKFKLITDPARNPKQLFSTLFSGIGSFGDKFKLLSLKSKLRKMSVSQIFAQEEISTLEVFKKYGFSQGFQDQFLKPFFAGIFLDANLDTSRRMFDFCFKMFSEGLASVPSKGMAQIPLQIYEGLKKDTVIFNTRISKITGTTLLTAEGEMFTGNTVIFTVPANVFIEGLPSLSVPYKTAYTLYYKYSQSPLENAFLALNSKRGGLINHIAVLTDVSSAYSYTSDALISVSVVDSKGYDSDLLKREVKKELKQWFGPDASYWELINYYEIQTALPNQDSVCNELDLSLAKVEKGVYRVGDYMLNGSINGALRAGKQMAEALLA